MDNAGSTQLSDLLRYRDLDGIADVLIGLLFDFELSILWLVARWTREGRAMHVQRNERI